MTEALILIVEDNEQNMKLVRDVLGHVGYRTLEAGDAELGIELARTHRPDLILMDVQLPGMNGMEALAQLRSDPVTAELRVVAVTAFAMKEDPARILAAGFDGYLEKPLDVRAFPGQVSELLSGVPGVAI
jgi:CheY-like chemotaxis protein